MQAVLTRELGLYGGLQLGGTVDGSVARLAGRDRLDGGGPDVFRCLEIRFAGTETQDVTTVRAQFGHEREDGTGRRGLHPRHARRN